MFGGERLPTSLLVLLVVVAVLKNPVLLVVVAVPGVAAHLLAARDTIGSAGLLLFVAIYWMLLSGTWLLTGVAATFGGVIASLVTGDLWPLPVVLVAGSLVGWLATLVCFGTMVILDDLRGSRDTDHGLGGSDLVLWSVGPAVAIAVAIVVTLAWM